MPQRTRIARAANIRKGNRTMLPNAFINKPKKPTNDELAEALGPAKALWDKLITDLSDELNLVEKK